MLGSSYSLRPKRSRRPDHRQLFHKRIVRELPGPAIAHPHYPFSSSASATITIRYNL